MRSQVRYFAKTLGCCLGLFSSLVLPTHANDGINKHPVSHPEFSGIWDSVTYPNNYIQSWGVRAVQGFLALNESVNIAGNSGPWKVDPSAADNGVRVYIIDGSPGQLPGVNLIQRWKYVGSGVDATDMIARTGHPANEVPGVDCTRISRHASMLASMVGASNPAKTAGVYEGVRIVSMDATDNTCSVTTDGFLAAAKKIKSLVTSQCQSGAAPCRVGVVNLSINLPEGVKFFV